MSDLDRWNLRRPWWTKLACWFGIHTEGYWVDRAVQRVKLRCIWCLKDMTPKN